MIRHISNVLLLVILIFVLTSATSAAVTTLPDGSVKLTADDAGEFDEFGGAVAVDGDTAVVGAAYTDSGAVYVFVQDGEGNWTQQQTLTADDRADGEQFGGAVAVSGDTIVVGVPFAADDVAGDNSGAAYVFVRDEQGNWAQQQMLMASDAAEDDFFGISVAVDADTVLVGAYYDDNEGGNLSGAAYVFVRDEQGNWTQQQKLLPDNPAPFDWFGEAVAVDGDTAVVGAKFDDGGLTNNSGAAYVFVRDEQGNWTQQARLAASDAAANDQFGSTVAVSADTVVVGAAEVGAGLRVGAAYVFVRDEQNNWTQQQRLSASDSADFDGFGSAVSVAGDVAVVGATGADGAMANSGAVYAFVRDEQGDWTERGKLSAYDGDTSDFFGSAVAVSGITIVTGAYGYDDSSSNSGAAYVQRLPLRPGATDVNGDTYVTPADAIYVINRIGTPDMSADLDGNEVVDQQDAAEVIAALGQTIHPN